MVEGRDAELVNTRLKFAAAVRLLLRAGDSALKYLYSPGGMASSPAARHYYRRCTCVLSTNWLKARWLRPWLTSS
jgi:hypothetical protein